MKKGKNIFYFSEFSFSFFQNNFVQTKNTITKNTLKKFLVPSIDAMYLASLHQKK